MPNYVSIAENKMDDFVKAAKFRMNNAIKESVKEQAEEILAKAQSLCPVSVHGQEGGKYPHASGNLRDSLYAQVSKGGHFAKIGVDIKKAYYAYMVHFGTVHQAPNPFLYKAKERVTGELAPKIESNFAKGA